MKKTILCVVVLSVSTISSSICMDQTSPRSAHPELVEGRRGSNHAIAPEEQRRMDALHQIWRSENEESISFCGILPSVGVRTATYYKEKKVYRACLTRVALLKPGRFTFVEEELVHQQEVYAALKNMYEASKEHELQTLQKN